MGLAAAVEAAGRLTTSISVLEWPILHTMQLFFIRSRCSLVTTFLFPASRERLRWTQDKGKHKTSDFFPALESEKLILEEHQVNFHQDTTKEKHMR